MNLWTRAKVRQAEKEAEQTISRRESNRKRGPLSDEERERLIEQTRSELHDLDLQVEKSVERLRDVASS